MSPHITDPRPHITCPECHRTSWHPGDVADLYCGYCHWWTSDPALAPHNPAGQNNIPSSGLTRSTVYGW